MRILFDQGTPVAIRNALQSHTVRTAREEGWSTLSNRVLTMLMHARTLRLIRILSSFDLDYIRLIRNKPSSISDLTAAFHVRHSSSALTFASHRASCALAILALALAGKRRFFGRPTPFFSPKKSD